MSVRVYTYTKATQDSDALISDGIELITSSPTQPNNPSKGDIWIDESQNPGTSYLKQGDVVDALNSTSTTAPLSAKQGKALNDAVLAKRAGTKTLAVFTPMTSQPPAAAFATLDTRNSIAVLDFDDGATNESTTFVGIIPEGANLSSGILVRIFWMATSATSGDCRWGVQFEKYGTDNDADSFDTAIEGHTTCSGTSGIAVVTELTATAIDSLAAGDQFRLKLYRDSSDTTNDTMTGDAELLAVELRGVA